MTKKEDRFGEPNFLQEYDSYGVLELQELFTLLTDQIKAAEKAGFTDCRVTFCSTTDPYDNISGPVMVEVRGMRDLTPREKTLEEENKRIYKLATALGVSYHEASVIDRANKLGKVVLK